MQYKLSAESYASAAVSGLLLACISLLAGSGWSGISASVSPPQLPCLRCVTTSKAILLCWLVRPEAVLPYQLPRTRRKSARWRECLARDPLPQGHGVCCSDGRLNTPPCLSKLLSLCGSSLAAPIIKAMLSPVLREATIGIRDHYSVQPCGAVLLGETCVQTSLTIAY